MAVILNRYGSYFGDREYHNKDADIQNAYYGGYGRAYGYWIDEGTRNSAIAAFSDGLPILNPAYVIESLIRDEIHAEHHLKMKMSGVSSGVSSTVVVTGCKQTASNAYTGAWLSFYDPAGVSTNSHDARILTSSYSSGDTTLTLSSAVHRTASSIDLPAKISDIRTGYPSIDTTSFDAVANSFSLDDILTGSSGSTTVLPVNHVINQKADVQSIISGILYDHFLFLYKDYDTYYLSPLWKDTNFLTTAFSNPLKADGIPQIKTSLSPIDIVYNSFKFNYAYDYGSGSFKRSISVNSDSVSIDSLYSGFESDLTDACASVDTTYGGRVMKEMNVDLISARDEEEAYFFIKRFVPFFTLQKLIVTFKGDLITFKDYRPGQQVKINESSMIPTGINNSSHFIIYSRKLVNNSANKYFEFKLMQIPE